MPPDRGESQARAIAFSPNSQQIVAGLTNGNIKVWDTATGASLRSWNAHSAEIEAIAISPDRQFSITGSSDRTVEVWELNSGRRLQRR